MSTEEFNTLIKDDVDTWACDSRYKDWETFIHNFLQKCADNTESADSS